MLFLHQHICWYPTNTSVESITDLLSVSFIEPSCKVIIIGSIDGACHKIRRATAWSICLPVASMCCCYLLRPRSCLELWTMGFDFYHLRLSWHCLSLRFIVYGQKSSRTSTDYALSVAAVAAVITPTVDPTEDPTSSPMVNQSAVSLTRSPIDTTCEQ